MMLPCGRGTSQLLKFVMMLLGGRRSRDEVGGLLDTIHGRSRMTMDPRIPTLPRKEHVRFSPTRQTLLAPSAKRREVFGESHVEHEE